jgi:hypothetical protein
MVALIAIDNISAAVRSAVVTNLQRRRRARLGLRSSAASSSMQPAASGSTTRALPDEFDNASDARYRHRHRHQLRRYDHDAGTTICVTSLTTTGQTSGNSSAPTNAP